MDNARFLLCLLVSTVALSGGCRSGDAVATREPAQAGAQEPAVALAQVSHSEEGLASYINETRAALRTFRQTDLGRREGISRTYERTVRPEGRVEGSLVGRAELPLSRYLDPHSGKTARPQLDWPAGAGRRVDAFFVDFKPPLMEWPVAAEVGESVESRAKITAYERDGVPFAYGTVRRTMRVVGHESLRVGGQVFDDSVRMEAQSELSFGWLATIRVFETAWFARGAGLVRREERYTGRALWLFRFQGTSGYELAEALPDRVEMVAERVGGPKKADINKEDRSNAMSLTQEKSRPSHFGKWSYLAICFDRAGRRIQVSGLAVEFAGSNNPE